MSQDKPKPPSAEVAELAEGCRRFVRESVGVALDGTQDTLPLLDHYLWEVPADAPEDVKRLVAASAGAYFGEVVRGHLPGARWVAPAGHYEAWRVQFETCFLAFHPAAMAWEALEGAEVPGWFGNLHVSDEDREALQQAFERVGAVAEEDYYRLAVRFEAIQLAYEVLAARRSEGGRKRRQPFGPEAYAHLDAEESASEGDREV